MNNYLTMNGWTQSSVLHSSISMVKNNLNFILFSPYRLRIKWNKKYFYEYCQFKNELKLPLARKCGSKERSIILWSYQNTSVSVQINLTSNYPWCQPPLGNIQNIPCLFIWFLIPWWTFKIQLAQCVILFI